MINDCLYIHVVKNCENISKGCSGIRFQTYCCVSFCVQYIFNTEKVYSYISSPFRTHIKEVNSRKHSYSLICFDAQTSFTNAHEGVLQ